MYTKAVIPYKPSSSSQLLVYMKVSYVRQGSAKNKKTTTIATNALNGKHETFIPD